MLETASNSGHIYGEGMRVQLMLSVSSILLLCLLRVTLSVPDFVLFCYLFLGPGKARVYCPSLIACEKVAIRCLLKP